MSEELEQDVQLEEQPVEQVEVAAEAPEIEVVDDRPEQDRRPPRVGEPKLEDPGDKDLPKWAQRRIATMSYNVHEEQRQRLDAERQRDEAIAWARRVAQQNQEAEGRAAFGTKIAIESTNARFAAEHDKAVEDLKQAFDAGDAAKIAESNLPRGQDQFAADAGPTGPSSTGAAYAGCSRCPRTASADSETAESARAEVGPGQCQLDWQG